MTEKPTRRRRRILLVPLLGLGVAAWVVRSRLVERRTLQEGWQPLPPSPVRPAPVESGEEAEEAGARRGPHPGRARRGRRRIGHRPRHRARAVGLRRSAPARRVRATTGRRRTRATSVKGKTATRVFYAPGSPYYSRTRADVWFRTDDDARAAGFTARAPRGSG